MNSLKIEFHSKWSKLACAVQKFAILALFYFLALDLVTIPVYGVLLLGPAAETSSGL
jgi:hypothetical protein